MLMPAPGEESGCQGEVGLEQPYQAGFWRPLVSKDCKTKPRGEVVCVLAMQSTGKERGLGPGPGGGHAHRAPPRDQTSVRGFPLLPCPFSLELRTVKALQRLWGLPTFPGKVFTRRALAYGQSVLKHLSFLLPSLPFVAVEPPGNRKEN